MEKILHENKVEHNICVFQKGSNLLKAGFFDIILLDIEMEELSGMEVAERLRQEENDCRIVFLTSHKKYVFSAFDVDASYYLLKPIDILRLSKVLLKIIEGLNQKREACYTVKCGEQIHRIPVFKIEFAEVFGRKISLHTHTEVYTFNGRLEEVQQCFPNYFFRCHKSYLINLAMVTEYDKEMAVLQSGKKIPISRRKYSEFGSVFLSFLQEEGDI